MLFARDRSNYPLDVSVDDLGDGFVITVNAVAPADPEQVCALVATAVQNLAAALDDDPAAELRRIPVLDPAERAQLVTGWNDTAAAGPGGHAAGAVRGAGGGGAGCGGGGVRGQGA